MFFYPEKALLMAKKCQDDLANHATSKQAENQKMKEDLQAMKIQNRYRNSVPSDHGESRNLFGGDANLHGGSSGSESSNVPKSMSVGNHTQNITSTTYAPTRDATNSSVARKNVIDGDGATTLFNVPEKAYSFNDNVYIREEAHDPARDPINEHHPDKFKRESQNRPNLNLNESPREAQTSAGPNLIPGPLQWLLPNGVIAACPEFTPGTYRNWCREVKLWKSAQVGENPTQLISKVVTVSP